MEERLFEVIYHMGTAPSSQVSLRSALKGTALVSHGAGGREESGLPPDTGKMDWDDRKMQNAVLYIYFLHCVSANNFLRL